MDENPHPSLAQQPPQQQQVSCNPAINGIISPHSNNMGIPNGGPAHHLANNAMNVGGMPPYRRPGLPPSLSPSTPGAIPRSSGGGPPDGLPSNGLLSSAGPSPHMMPLSGMASMMPGMPGPGGPNLMLSNGPGIQNVMSHGGPPHGMMVPEPVGGPMPPMPGPYMGRMPFSPMARQPDHRIHDMNKRLQYRPDDNDVLWWEAFTSEFFEDNATLTLHFLLDDGPKRYTIGRILIPRYFRTIFESGCCELYYLLRCPREIFQHTTLIVDCETTDMVMNMDRPFPVFVVAEGRLVLEFVCDEFMRIRSWTFAIRSHREMLYRSMLGVPDSTFLENMNRNITRCGITYHTLNFLRMCVILEPMQELMSRQKAYSLTPRDCLKTTLYQKWMKMVSPTETSRPANKKRKRKAAQNASNNEANEHDSKKKAVPLPTLENAVGYGDVMIVGEPTLMGVNFGEEDERMITRMENVNFVPNSASGPGVPITASSISTSGGGAPSVNAGPSTPQSGQQHHLSRAPSMSKFNHGGINQSQQQQQSSDTTIGGDPNHSNDKEGLAMPDNAQIPTDHTRPVSVKSEPLFRARPPSNGQLNSSDALSWEGPPRNVQPNTSGSLSISGMMPGMNPLSANISSDPSMSLGGPHSHPGDAPTIPFSSMENQPYPAAPKMISSGQSMQSGIPQQPFNPSSAGPPGMMLPHGMQYPFIRGNSMMPNMEGSPGLPPMMHPNYGPPNSQMMVMPPGGMRMTSGGNIMMDPRYGPSGGNGGGPLPPHLMGPGSMPHEVTSRFSPAAGPMVNGPPQPQQLPPNFGQGIFHSSSQHTMHHHPNMISMSGPGPGPRMPTGFVGGPHFPPHPYQNEELQPSVN